MNRRIGEIDEISMRLGEGRDAISIRRQLPTVAANPS